jgi:hypothetical protein
MLMLMLVATMLRYVLLHYNLDPWIPIWPVRLEIKKSASFRLIKRHVLHSLLQRHTNLWLVTQI